MVRGGQKKLTGAIVRSCEAIAHKFSPEKMPGAHMPELGWLAMATRTINGFLKTSYTLEQVEGLGPDILTVVQALRLGYVKHFKTDPNNL